ncbi:MAG: hypothetical protein MJ109_06640, partial [Kiritimatiellae bacterium]|nr:hypothetical protein [Kiritimatiellia bacterium]
MSTLTFTFQRADFYFSACLDFLFSTLASSVAACEGIWGLSPKIQNANLASADAVFAVQDAKIPAINKGTNKEEYVTNDFLVKVWVRISEVTGEMPVTRIERKYKNIVKSEADSKAAERALDQYELAAERTKVEIQKQADEAREVAALPSANHRLGVIESSPCQ